jgi:hypothetical protein
MPAVPGTLNMTLKKELQAMYAEKEETGVSANAVTPLRLQCQVKKFIKD